MRGIIKRAAAAVVVLAGFYSGMAFAGDKPALVALIEHKAPTAGENSVLDRLAMLMIRNATRGRYSATRFLMDGRAEKSTFIRAISDLTSRGLDVDVIVLVPGSDSSLALARGGLSAGELISGLQNSRGHVRFVYLTSGNRSVQLADAWRELGAQSILSHVQTLPTSAVGGGSAPLFFPRFIKSWGAGESVSRAVSRASETSSAIATGFSPFVPDETLAANGGVLSPAPILSGSDLTIKGQSTQPVDLHPVVWPAPALPRAVVPHNALQEKLLGIMARAISTAIELKPEFVPGFSQLVGAASEPTWETLQSLFPGRNANEIMVPGQDVRVILSKVIPDFDKYMGAVVEHLDGLFVSRKNGKLLLDILLTPSQLRLPLKEEKIAKNGQPYAVELEQHIHAFISMKRDSIRVGNIRGVTVMVKLPFLPDGVEPRNLLLDAASEKLTVAADAVKGLLHVVGTADVRAKQFNGVDWLSTITKNLPLLLGMLLFSIL